MVKGGIIKTILIFVTLFLVCSLVWDSNARTKDILTYNDLGSGYFYPQNNLTVPFFSNPQQSPEATKQPNQSSLTCPEDISTYTDINTCNAFISGNLDPVFDEETTVQLTWEMTGATTGSSPSQGIHLIGDYTFEEGTTVITYTATETDGSTTTCSFTVTISDNQVPRLENIPANITVSADENECFARVTWIEPTAADNCTPAGEILLEKSESPGSRFPVGVTTVSYRAYDAMGNTSVERSFTVTVEDREPPVFQLPENKTIDCGTEIPPPWPSLQEAIADGGTVTDNCAIQPNSFRLSSETASSESCPYILTRIYQITDIHGNTTTAQHLIVVEGEGPETKTKEEVVPLKSGMAVIVSTAAGGPWNAGTSWEGGVVPQPGDDVEIVAGATITLTDNQACGSIMINGTFAVSGADTLQVSGNWTNNGTFTGGTYGTVEFTGTNPATISGTTTFEELIISKGSLTTLLNITGNTTISGGGSLLINSGLITIPGGGSLTVNPSKELEIPQIAGFDVTGGTLTTGNFTITNGGLIRVSSGTANFGTGTGNEVHTQSDGAFIVSGGTVKLSGRLYNSASGTLNPPGVPSGITISGGTVTLCTVGNGLSNVGSLNVTANGAFDFSGGTIVFQNPSTATTELDLGFIGGSGNKTISGGTFQFGNDLTSGSPTFNISSEIPLFNLTTRGNSNIALQSTLILGNPIVLNGTSKLFLNDHAIQIPVTGNGIYHFPLTDVNGNSIPASVNITGLSYSAGAYIQIQTIDTKHPENENSANYLNRYWTVTTSGITSPVYTVTAAYHSNDISGSISGFIVANYTGSAWNETGNAIVGGGTISITGINQSSFEFTALSEPTVTVSATPATICYGTSTQLLADAEGDPVFSYSWTPASGLSATNIANPVATPAITTTYTVTVTDGNGFTATDDILITVNPLPTAAITGTTTVCQNGGEPQITFTGNNGTAPYTFTYNIGGGANQTVTTTSGNSVTVAASTTAAGTYIYNLVSVEDNNSCSQAQTGSATVTVNPTPTINPVADQSVCNNTATTEVVFSGTATSYNWTNNNTSIGLAPSGTATIPAFTAINSGTTPAVATITITPVYSAGGVDCNGTPETFTITVNPVPTVAATPIDQTICPGSAITNIVITNPNSISGTTFSWVRDNIVTLTGIPENGSGSIISGSLNSSNPKVAEATTFTITASAAGCASSVTTAEVTVVDNTPPTFTVPGPLTVNANGSCDPPNLDPNVTLSKPYNLNDNCTASGSLASSYSDGGRVPTGICDGNYTITRTWTVTDAAGNSSSQDQIITVEDNTRPSLNVPPTISIECSDSDHPDSTGWATSTDNCSDVLIDWDDVTTPGVCVGRYTITRTWTATDDCGNFSTGEQTINVTDNTGPVVIGLGDTTVTCPDDRPDYYRYFSDFTADGGTATDNCGIIDTMYLYSEVANGLDNAPGYCPESIIRTYRFTDECGNYTDIVQTIYVTDDCGCSPCDPEVPFLWVDMLGRPTMDTIIYDKGREALCCDANNPMNCISFNIRLDDGAVGVEIGVVGATPNPMDWDVDCEDAFKDGDIICIPSGDFHLFTYCKPGGNENDWYVRSIAGVVLSEDVKTRVECGRELIAEGSISTPVWTSIYPGNEGDYDHYLSTTTDTITFFNPDENSPPEIRYQICGTPGSGVCTNEMGMICDTITVYVYDAIEIDLNINPDMVCDNNELPEIRPDISPASNTYELDWYSGHDASGILLCADCDSYQPTTDGAYSIVVTDVREGIPCSEETFNFDIVFDYTGPTVQEPPAPLVLQCNDPGVPQQIQDWLNSAVAHYINAAGNLVDTIVTNNFAGITMSCNDTLPVTFTAFDQCSNDSTRTSYIIVIDTIAPVITCPPATSNLAADWDSCHLSEITIEAPVVSDDCDTDVALTWRKTGATSGTGTGTVTGPFNVGETTVTYTATDDCGNQDSCVQLVTVIDIQPPNIECPPNVTATAEPPGCELEVFTIEDPIVTENCGDYSLTWKKTGATVAADSGNVNHTVFIAGVTTVTYYVTDEAGNSDSCSFTVTINDTIPPTIIDCPEDVTEYVTPGNCDVYVAVPGPEVEDPCGKIFTIHHNSPFTGSNDTIASGTYPVGEHTLTWTFTDIWGNDTTCTQIVTVIDTIPPVIAPPPAIAECPEFTVPAGSDLLDLDSVWITDNCETVCHFADYTLRWRIDFAGGSPSLPAGSGTYNTGQISDYGAGILFPSDSVTYTSLNHTVTYWVVDCSGNVSAAQTRTVTVYPPVIALPPADTLSYCHLDTVPAIPLTGYPTGVVFDISGGTALGLANQTGVTEIPEFWASQYGTAVITITPSANGCTGTPVTFVLQVIQRAVPQITPPFEVICSGETTNIHLTSNTTGANFSWTVSSVTPEGSVTGAFDDTGEWITQELISTTTEVATVKYAVVAEANGCTSPGNAIATVTVHPTPTLVITHPDTVCEPSVIDLTAAEITAGSSTGLTFTYWTDTTATTTLANPSAVAASGTYYIKGTSAAGCFAVLPVPVVINPLPELTSPLNPDGICSNTPFIYTPESNVGGTTFTWTRAAVSGISNLPESGTGMIDETLVNETSGPIEVTYVYTLTANGCTNIQEVKVVVTQSPILTNPLPPPGICSGQVFSFDPESNINPGTTFSWTRNADVYGNTSAASGNGNPNEVLYNNTDNPITVTYYYTLSSNNCTNPEVFQVNVTVTPSPDVTVSATHYEICPGESIDLFSDANINATLPPVILAEDFEETPSGWTRTPTTGDAAWTLRPDGYTYEYWVWWWNYSYTFHSDDASQFYLSNNHDQGNNSDTRLVSPQFSTEGYISVDLTFSHYYRDGGSSDHARVQWSPNGTDSWTNLREFTSSVGSEDGFVQETISLPVGQPSVYIRFWYQADDDYWWAIDNVSVTGEPQSQAEILWTSNPAGFTSTQADPTDVYPTETTTYTATYTDPDTDCPGSASVTVTVRETPYVEINPDYCTDPGYIILTATGGFTSYLWTTGDTTQTIKVDVAGNFFVTVTDAFGCTGIASYNTANELVINGDFEDGNTGFSSGYGFRDPWVTPPNEATSSANSALWDENYYGVGTNGRYYHTNFWGNDHTSGAGNFMIVNGNTNAGTAVWEQIVNVEPNTDYYFSAWAMSLNADGNDAVLRFEVNGVLVGTEAHLPAGESNYGNDGWVRFYSNPLWNSGSVSGPITIRIRNVEPSAGGNDFALDDISFGTLDPAPATVDAVSLAGDVVCEGDSIKLQMVITDGKEPFTYNWTGPNGFTSTEISPSIPNATLAAAGVYTATITDGYGCGPVYDTIIVTVNPAATVNAGPDQEVCASSPEVQLAGSFGGSTTSVTWTTLGSGTFSLATEPSAIYTLSATDTAAGVVTLVLATDDPAGICGVTTDTMNILIHPEVFVSLDTLENPLCPGSADGYITVSVSGGTAPYTYSWNTSPVQTGATAGGLAAGTYTVTVTDASGCQDTLSATLVDPPALVVNDTIFTTPVTCYNGDDGTATVEVLSGENPTYIWSNGDTTATATGLAAGIHSVTIYSENWCSSVTIPFAITQPLPPTVDCPEDMTVYADYGEDFASDVNLSAPDYVNDCPLVDQVWVLSGATADSSASSGIHVLTSHDFNLGVTTVTYTFVDEAGNPNICSFTVTVESAPIIECPDDTVVYAGAVDCSFAFDPGIPELIQGGAPIDWTWRMTGATEGSGGTAGANLLPDSIGVVSFNLGTTTITWTATNVSGADTCFHTVEVRDTIPPTITAAGYENCVDPLHSATYDPVSPNPVVNHIDPNLEKYPVDFRTFPAGDTSLDLLTLEDNCCDSTEMTIHWRIDFLDTPDPLVEGNVIIHPPISGTGQPSRYGSDIYLWGDGVYFTTKTHTITYWVEDCNGQVSDELVREIVIDPRPNIIKMN